jgi:hypothetical protein
MDNLYALLTSALLVCVLVWVIDYVYVNFKKNRNRTRETDILEYEKLTRRRPPISDMDSEIEDFVRNCLTEYCVMHPEISKLTQINSKAEDLIRKTVSDMVKRRMSSVFIRRIEYYYSTDSIPEIIASKIYLIITDFVLNHNVEAQRLAAEESTRRKRKYLENESRNPMGDG